MYQALALVKPERVASCPFCACNLAFSQKAAFAKLRAADYVIVTTSEQLLLGVCHFPNYCLLSPLMSPKDRKCKLIDWLID